MATASAEKLGIPDTAFEFTKSRLEAWEADHHPEYMRFVVVHGDFGGNAGYVMPGDNDTHASSYILGWCNGRRSVDQLIDLR